MRIFCGIICGFLGGTLLLLSISAGVHFRFPNEMSQQTWGVMLWGEHWFIRTIVSVICTAWGGFLAGIISRNYPKISAIISAMPSWLAWVVLAVFSFTGISIYQQIDPYSSYVSIGNKIFIVINILCIFPVAWYSGQVGGHQASFVGDHFDSRPHTLLGIKWYHYLWIPIIFYLISMQASYVGLYFIGWLKVLYKSSSDFSMLTVIVPGIFTAALWATLYIMWLGLSKAYYILAGYTENLGRGRSFLLVLKYVIIYQVVAVACQTGIEYVHFYVSKWVRG